MDVQITGMTDKDFKRLSVVIYNDYGIKMPETKKIMLEGRLRKRLKANNISSYSEYCDYVLSDQGMQKELVYMIDVVSTNKTDFFREPGHFDFMNEYLYPTYAKERNNEPLKIWSSACSTGEEPYTIAITLEEYFKSINKKAFDYTIHCTDISTQVLKKAVGAIYDESRVINIPLEIKRRYFLRSKDREERTVRIIPELRKKLTFNRLNLMDEAYAVPHNFDIIFCRNVLIYFDKEVQEKVINKLCDRLKPGGYFFLGHSESIAGMKVPLKQLKPTIFKKI